MCWSSNPGHWNIETVLLTAALYFSPQIDPCHLFVLDIIV